MRCRIIAGALVALLASSGCGTAPADPMNKTDTAVTTAVTGSTGTTEAMTETVSATVEAKGDGQWLVRVAHTCGGQTGSGEIIIKQAVQPKMDQVPHAGLAGAKAYLSIAQTLQQGGKAKEAVECAQAGITELGETYAAPTEDDDTSVKLRAARNRIKEGALVDGATVMINVLQIRINLYTQLHVAELG